MIFDSHTNIEMTKVTRFKIPYPKLGLKAIGITIDEFTRTICAMVKSGYIGDGYPTFNRNPYNKYINPYYWVDDNPILFGNCESLDPGTFG